ncbi:hypothetical protein FV218_10955 [Methylobacterium sp. WL69]|uniref:hypothetical protein n=1 Tax=Methylobacterium sp. WL69 TaxID=2603893 RepID=UPI0011C76B34|nr:hypothetical protein [Methylobacterium sp. WL69]TXM73725.1 hypothetical protein FV218_10955 [Methylobacterium sp. WL69]
MPRTDTLPLLAKAESPTNSAMRLIRKHGLPNHLRPKAISSLARWLSARLDCRTSCTTVGTEADVAARRASRLGEPIDAFRLSTDASYRAGWTLKNLRLADGHSRSHADAQVVHMAKKVLRGFRADRLDWDGLTDGLAELRSLITISGHKRVAVSPIAGAESYHACKGKTWTRVITVDRLRRIGAKHGLCTAASHSRAADYARALRDGSLKFYELVGPTGSFLALLSIRASTHSVEEMRGPGNELVQGINGSVKRLLKALAANVGECDDLLGVGLSDGFLDRDLSHPDGTFGATRLWRDPEGSILIEEQGRWAALRKLDEGIYIGRGNYDADNLIGSLANAALAGSAIG